MVAGALLSHPPDRRNRIVRPAQPVLIILALVLACVPLVPRAARAAEPKPVSEPARPTAATPAKPAATPVAAPAGVDSLAMLEKAVARDSSKFDKLYALGVLYMDRERMLEALRVLDKASR